mmetsp:Transcript_57252/g.113700  ORF Transcript_57252/g.113700 Transcript_57252/m.113700 type:complete len:189 (-) Transcript_57252:155-721(-)
MQLHANAQPADSSGAPPVLILMAHLTSHKNIHGGSFGDMARSGQPVQRLVDIVLRSGPVFAEGMASARLRVVILHDHPSLAMNTSYRGFRLRYTTRHRGMPGNDARWGLYRSALARETADCAFTVDLGDAFPNTLDLHRLCDDHPDTLMVASDSCRRRQVWNWLEWTRRMSNFSASATLDAHLVGPSS